MGKCRETSWYWTIIHVSSKATGNQYPCSHLFMPGYLGQTCAHLHGHFGYLYRKWPVVALVFVCLHFSLTCEHDYNHMCKACSTVPWLFHSSKVSRNSRTGCQLCGNNSNSFTHSTVDSGANKDMAQCQNNLWSKRQKEVLLNWFTYVLTIGESVVNSYYTM